MKKNRRKAFAALVLALLLCAFGATAWAADAISYVERSFDETTQKVVSTTKTTTDYTAICRNCFPNCRKERAGCCM